MANPRICTVAGCDNTGRVTAGLCSMHYQRLRRLGRLDGLDVPLSKRGVPRAFLIAAFSHTDGAHCLTWPYAKDAEGRARVNYGGRRSRLAHQVVCEATHGARPTPAHEAAHSCGNGHLACINPHHLRWATRLENESDKVQHGTSQHGARNHRAKLTPADVAEIRSLVGSASQRRIAQRFGVTQSAVSMIQRGQRWAA